MKLAVKVFLHVLLAGVTMAIGVAFVLALRLLTPSSKPPATEPPPPVLRPLESVTIPRTSLELACYDPHILPIWSELKKDDEFKDRIDGETGQLNCSEMLEVRRLDLNRDGNDEVVVRGKGPDLCSGTGNCGFWVFERLNGRTRVLLSGSSYFDATEIGPEIQRSRTRSYSDILLTGHSSAAETSYRTYKYDGRRYTETRCMYQVPRYDSPDGRRLQWITCAEYDRGSEADAVAATAKNDK
jgi:hypothetical protein